MLVKPMTVKDAKVGMDVKYIGYPVYLQGSRGRITSISSMQPEVVTLILRNGKRLVTDVFHLTAINAEEENLKHGQVCCSTQLPK